VTIKTCNAFPYGANGLTSTIIACLEDITKDLSSERTNHSNVRAVINLSFNSAGCELGFDDLFKEAIAQGAIIVTAAGNNDDDACSYSPSCSNYVITVGAYDYTGTRWTAASSGSNYGDCVDTWGPGHKILSSKYVNGTYMTATGTTMATAIVGGMAGNFLSLYPNTNTTSYPAIKEILSTDYLGLFSFAVDDCQGPNCRALSLSCEGLAYLQFSDVDTPAPTKADVFVSPYENGDDEFGAYVGLVLGALLLIAFAYGLYHFCYVTPKRELEERTGIVSTSALTDV